MNRRIIPPTRSDRLLAIAAVFGVSYSIFGIVTDDWVRICLGILLAVTGFISAYLLQDNIEAISEESNEYLEIIAQLKDMGKKIESMSAFMEKGQKRIIEAEKTIHSLSAEKEKLEPIVETQRNTVEAILEAHSNRVQKHQWKERVLSFALGIIASLIAAYGYSFFAQTSVDFEINMPNKAIPLRGSGAADG